MAKNTTDLKALKEANGETKENLNKIQDNFIKNLGDFVDNYLNLLTSAKNKTTMAYISQDICKMFLKGQIRLQNLNDKITEALEHNNLNYAEKLIDSMADNIENKGLDFFCSSICRAHDNFLTEIMDEQTSESVVFQIKNSADLFKEIKSYSEVDAKKKKKELDEKRKFYLKNII